MRNALLLALSVLLQAACSGEDAAATPAAVSSQPLPRACELVSAGQAQAVLGQGVGLMSDEPENCIWASADSPARIVMLMIQVSEAGSVAEAQDLFRVLTGMPGDLSQAIGDQAKVDARESGQPLPTLGDEAWLSAGNADLVATRQLFVRKGARVLTLNVTGMAADDAIAARLQSLAREIAVQL